MEHGIEIGFIGTYMGAGCRDSTLIVKQTGKNSSNEMDTGVNEGLLRGL